MRIHIERLLLLWMKTSCEDGGGDDEDDDHDNDDEDDDNDNDDCRSGRGEEKSPL